MTDDIVARLRKQFDLIAFDDITNEAANEIERLRADRDRWRDLAEYLCQNANSVSVPEWIASRFPDPLAVRGE